MAVGGRRPRWALRRLSAAGPEPRAGPVLRLPAPPGRPREADLRAGRPPRQVVAEDLVEQVFVDAGGVEGIAAATVRDRQSGGSADVFAGHPQPTVPRGVGGGGAELAVTWRGNFDGESETVEELRAEFAFFGVHGADEGETCGVDNRGAAGQSLSRPLVIQLNVLVVCVLDPFIRVKRRRGGRLFGLVGKVDLARIVKVRLELSVHALTLRCRAGGHLRGRIGAANTKQWRCRSRRLIRWVRSPVLATLGADHYYDSHTTTNRPHPHRLVLRNHQTGVERQP